jgi:hypothetical protein
MGRRQRLSEGAIAEAREAARQYLGKRPPTLDAQRKVRAESKKIAIERMKKEGVTPQLRHLATCPKCLQHWMREGGKFIMFELAAALIEAGESLPPPLRPLIAATLRELSFPELNKLDTHPKAEKWTRDDSISGAVCYVSRVTGLSPTRNLATDAPSGCSIVADALREYGINRSEALVEKIWQKDEFSREYLRRELWRPERWREYQKEMSERLDHIFLTKGQPIAR